MATICTSARTSPGAPAMEHRPSARQCRRHLHGARRARRQRQGLRHRQGRLRRARRRSPSPVVVPVTSFYIPDSEHLFIGETVTLRPNGTPGNATYRTPADFTWETSDANIATVEDGVVTGVGYGTAIITAISHNGLTDYCLVTVTVPTDEIEISLVGSERAEVKRRLQRFDAARHGAGGQRHQRKRAGRTSPGSPPIRKPLRCARTLTAPAPCAA